MSVWTKSSDMVRFTCNVSSAKTSNARSATDRWGSTAIDPLEYAGQHNWAWANGFIPRVYDKKPNKAGGFNQLSGCDRDEWPPRYSWLEDEAAAKKGLVQRVRLNPSKDNRGAGQIWNNFCNKYGAQSISRKMKNKKVLSTYSWIQCAYVRTKQPIKAPSPPRVGKDGVTSRFCSLRFRRMC
jgi:hypothetical protein